MRVETRLDYTSKLFKSMPLLKKRLCWRIIRPNYLYREIVVLTFLSVYTHNVNFEAFI